LGASAVFDLHQARLQLKAIHTALPKPLSNQCTAISNQLAALRRSQS
jgi:DNA-binding FrmR family transcriptional regulator